MEKRAGRVDYILRNIPEDVWVEVKIAAAKRRQSIREFLLELIQKKIQGEKKRA